MKLKDTKWVKRVLGIVGAIVAGGAIMLGGVVVGYPAISQLVGLAVAQSSTLWNNVKDAAVGDSLSSGILAQSTYLWNGASFDRVRGTGGSMNVTSIGSITPADTYANPTTASQVWALNGLWNGTTWDRWRGSITNGALIEKKTVGTSQYNILRVNITTASVNLAFGFTSRKVLVSAPSTNTQNLCIDWLGGTAVCPAANTAGDGTLLPGTTIIVDDYAGTSISVIAASGTQSFSVSAWN